MRYDRACGHVMAMLLVLSARPVAAQEQSTRLDIVTDFDPAGRAPVRVEGAEPGETLMLVLRRVINVWRPDPKGGPWKSRPISFYSWAELTADGQGRIDPATARPGKASYTEADPMALMWSGYAEDDAALDTRLPPALRNFAASDGQVGVRLYRDARPIADGTFAERSIARPLDFETVQQPGLVGVYATPRGAKQRPTLIILHGSEGNDIAKARANAASFAQQGFAAFAIAYYTQSYAPAANVPTSGIEIDVNQVDRARRWLTGKAGADPKRMGIWGLSKGGEFAMIAASRFPWIKAAVGCVPSDIVWQGFGDGENTLPPRSTWQLDGKPLPFVPLYPFVEGRYRDNTDRYERSRRLHPGDADLARIPIERTQAKLLLIGSDRDEVWASGAMVRSLKTTLIRAGKAGRVETMVFDKAGHGICGDGSFPVRAYGRDDPDQDRKSLDAEGKASVRAFRGTIAFFKATLGR
jgi:poly(3-hydroxybutyrate) depolymerase